MSTDKSDSRERNGTEEFEIDIPEMKERLQTLASLIDVALPEGWGFNLLLFTFEPGATFYISNARRDTMLAALQEFIRAQKERGH